MNDAPMTPPQIAARLVDPRAYGESRALHEDFTWLRKHLPVSSAQVEGFDPFWVITRHADIAEISRHNVDAPDHPKYRALTQQWFTHQSITNLTESAFAASLRHRSIRCWRRAKRAISSPTSRCRIRCASSWRYSARRPRTSRAC